MSLPVTPFPFWASNGNYATGPDAGTPTKIVPPGTSDGFIRNTAAVPQYMNYLLESVYEHVEYLRNITSENLTWGGLQTFNDLTVTGTATLSGLSLTSLFLPGNLEVDGTTQLDGPVTITDGASFTGSNDVTLAGTTKLKTDGNIYVNGFGTIQLNNTNNIEIWYGNGATLAARPRQVLQTPGLGQEWVTDTRGTIKIAGTIVGSSASHTFLRVPRGAIISQVLIQVQDNAASGAMVANIYKVTGDPGVAGASGGGLNGYGASLGTANNAATPGDYGIVLTPGAGIFVDEGSMIAVEVLSSAGGIGAGLTNYIFSLETTYFDPGPRNG